MSSLLIISDGQLNEYDSYNSFYLMSGGFLFGLSEDAADNSSYASGWASSGPAAESGAGNTGGMNFSIPWSSQYEVLEEGPDVIILDEQSIAARIFAKGKSQILAAQIAVLMKKK